CPICFLYYPQNTNYTRCCHKPICTECFVQIKRRITDACVAPTHCPYCVAPNLGVAYYYALGIAALRAGYMRHRPRLSSNLSHGSMAAESSAREPAVVMTDDIRPALLRELTAALQAKHREQLRSAENMALVAAATRRASERATDGGGLLLFPRPDHHRPAARMFGRGAGSASALRQTPPPPPPPQAVPEYMAYIAAMHAAGRVDLEEFLVQEAIRQSLAGQAPPAGEEGAAMQNSEPAAEADAAARMLGGLDIAASSGQHGGSEGEEVAGSAPLVLDDSELDAIANVTSRPRPPAAASDTITSPVLTAVATAASPDDLISFAAVDADAL
ncbi:SNF1-interacting protein, partial [Coemansia sp. RSA 2052]